MTTTRVEVDQDRCQSAGYCVRTAPEIFALDDDGIVAIRAAGRLSAGPVEVAPADLDQVDRAAWDCPAAAITVTQQTQESSS